MEMIGGLAIGRVERIIWPARHMHLDMCITGSAADRCACNGIALEQTHISTTSSQPGGGLRFWRLEKNKFGITGPDDGV